MDKGDSGPAESGSGEPGTDASGSLEGTLHNDIELGARDFVVITEGGVAGDHEGANLVKVTGFEGDGKLFNTVNFCYDVSSTPFNCWVEYKV